MTDKLDLLLLFSICGFVPSAKVEWKQARELDGTN